MLPVGQGQPQLPAAAAAARGGGLTLTLRACVVSAALGVLFTFITLRLTLGPAGMTPPLTIPAGLLSYVLLKAAARVVPRSAPITPQENAVAQTMATACYKIVGYAGYSSYLTALSYPVYLAMGGVPRGTAGYDADVVVEPDLHRVYPYLTLIAFGGVFALLGLRKLLIVQWRLPFPSGGACGSMINSLHLAAAPAHAERAEILVAAAALPAAAPAPAPAPAAVPLGDDRACKAAAIDDGVPATMAPDARNAAAVATAMHEAAAAAASGADPGLAAARKVRVLAWTALASLLFDVIKWLVQGPKYDCGFATWPTFGQAAARWTWRLDFQQQYIGSGFLVPHVVAWSMLLGAVLAWGIMWPLISRREGSWYAAGLAFGDMRGLAGYQIFLSMSLLLGEGAFILGKAALLGLRQLRAYQLKQRLARQHRRHQQQHQRRTSSDGGAVSGSAGVDAAGRSAGTGPCALPAKHCGVAEEEDAGAPCAAVSTSFSRHTKDACTSGDVRLRVRASSEAPRQHAPALQQQQQQQQQLGGGPQPASPLVPLLPGAPRHHCHHSRSQGQQRQQQQQQQQPQDSDAAVAFGAERSDTAPHAHNLKEQPLSAGAAAPTAAAGAWRAMCPAACLGAAGAAAAPPPDALSEDDEWGEDEEGSMDGDGGRCAGGVAGAAFRETRQERKEREAVFCGDPIPRWWGPAGYASLAVLGTGCIPLIYPPARWYMVAVAFLAGPPVALVNGFGAGLTDVDNSGNFATVAMFLFSLWAAAAGGNGVVAGCVISGVLMVFSVSAAVLLQDLRTGYVTMTRPRAMLAGQLAGAAFGVLFSPLAFALIWSTGEVGRPDGPYPAPFAAVTRGVVQLGSAGAGALPRHCAALSAAFFGAALAICGLREALPPCWGRFVPSPMAMAFPFFIPASAAIDFWLGSVAVLLWEARAPASASACAPLVGAGLLVGDGLWSIPAAVLAAASVAPPLCAKF